MNCVIQDKSELKCNRNPKEVSKFPDVERMMPTLKESREEADVFPVFGLESQALQPWLLSRLQALLVHTRTWGANSTVGSHHFVLSSIITKVYLIYSFSLRI